MHARLETLRALLAPYPWAYSVVVLTTLLLIVALAILIYNLIVGRRTTI